MCASLRHSNYELMSSLLASATVHLFRMPRLILGAVFLLSLIMFASALQLRMNAGFSKMLPQGHAYMEVYERYQRDFGNANQILFAITVRDGDIFTPEFFELLKRVTDDVFFVPGVDRTKVYSLYTPNVRFVEVVEDGMRGGNLIPADFQPTAAGFAGVKGNLAKSGYIGSLVAHDFTGAAVRAQLQDTAANGETLNLLDVAEHLEAIRVKYQEEYGQQFDFHILGFAKRIGDIAAGAEGAFVFFVVTFVVSMALVYAYTRSWRLTSVLLLVASLAVVWQLGFVHLLRFDMDPMSIAIPFLIFAVSLSHGMHMIGAFRSERSHHRSAACAARATLRRLFIPGVAAVATDLAGIAAILYIDIPMILEMAIITCIGLLTVLILNLLIMPLLLSLVADGAHTPRATGTGRSPAAVLLNLLGSVTASSRSAGAVVLAAIVIAAFAASEAANVRIGESQNGAPELKVDAVYNADNRIVGEKFFAGLDVLAVIAETAADGCIDDDVLERIDQFQWRMRNESGVRAVAALPDALKQINMGWNEGYPKWRVLPHDSRALAQSIAFMDSNAGLFNADCSAMPVLIYLQGHTADLVDRIVQRAEHYSALYASEKVRFRLAAGNIGVSAATNEVIRDAQLPVIVTVFLLVLLMNAFCFRSFKGAWCVVLPLLLVSLATYAVMAVLGISVKVNTLAVISLSAGIGVDYGIYIFSRMQALMNAGQDVGEAYRETLKVHGKAALFMATVLGIGVCTWVFSPLKLQADMGLLFVFSFVANVISALVLMPALATLCFRGGKDFACGYGQYR